MPTTKLIIVPVILTLSLIFIDKFILIFSNSSCVIKTATAEISFYNVVDEQINQTIMKKSNIYVMVLTVSQHSYRVLLNSLI
ncbi:hypothetical protein [Lysinibacillus fusiformis]|uniref:hypothetical protein n=1 Tax=Lysinibacillus fusiformis TaxID=28031 RepID=UPI001642B36C|nr:hypothetical protein [Lysinibacillus fusiformis]